MSIVLFEYWPVAVRHDSAWNLVSECLHFVVRMVVGVDTEICARMLLPYNNVKVVTIPGHEPLELLLMTCKCCCQFWYTTALFRHATK